MSGLFPDNWLSALAGNRLYKIRAKQVVLATGGFDQPLVFAGNDRPGIMFADAAQRLMRLYGVKPGTTAVIATANRFGYEAALDFVDAGVAVAAVVDLTPDPKATRRRRGAGTGRADPAGLHARRQPWPKTRLGGGGRRCPRPGSARLARMDRLRSRPDERRLYARPQPREPYGRQGHLRPAASPCIGPARFRRASA